MADLFKRPRISRATIARLHNRGNYEHSRYEVTVEIPAGIDAGAVMLDVDQMLDELTPVSPVSKFTLFHALKDASNTQDELRAAEARKTIVEHDEWERRRAAAFARFTQFGGVERYVDAKLDFDQDE